MVRTALKKPIAILVLFIGLLLFSVMAIRTIPIDIFPKLNAPTIYVIEQYGGMSAKQMEGFFATRMQDQFLYINGIKNIESKNIQGLSLIKLTFYENTDMAEATAQVALQSNRTLAFFPPGSLPPQVLRFDASSLPVGELVFSSKTRSLKDMFDLALTRVRPLFATVPGLSAAPAFGSNARTVVINVDPQKLSTYNLTADEVVDAIAKNNSITPSGNLRVDSTMYVTTVNSLEDRVQQFENIPVKSNGSTTVFVSDVAKVADGADVTVDYALVNGKRSVYIPIVKSADASTWDVVQTLRSRIPEMQSLLPDDVKISYEFDQSVFVMNSAKSLMTEGILGAILTALMVLLFLQDWRSSVVVIITIPVAVLIAVFFLKLAGQTINIMTLSGLALAIGILVDQATVTIENIHQHLEMGKNKKQAILDACSEISFPLLLILLCILAVFAPALVMNGVPKAMFLPLSLSIAFAMIISFIAAQTLVPVIANWILKEEKFQYHHNRPHAHAGLDLDENEAKEISLHNEEDRAHPEGNNFFQRLKISLANLLERWMPARKLIVIIYLILSFGAAALCYVIIGKDLLPKTNNGQLQLRIREPDGTRLEITEQTTKDVLNIIDSTVDHHIAITSAYVGLVPSNFGTSNLYIFNSGTHEAVIQVNLKKDYKVNIEDLKESLRTSIIKHFPNLKLSFEPIELTEKIMAQGASTPVEVRVAGKDMNDIKNYSAILLDKLKAIPFLRDVQIAQPLHFPTVNITIDRQKLALMGLSLDNVSRSITASTSSSRYVSKNFWLDDKTSYTYQTQVQVPEYIMNSIEELQETPLVKGQARPILSDVATLSTDSLPGEYDRSGPRRFVTISANIYKKDLGTATDAVQKAIKDAGKPPTGLVTEIKGMSSLLTETLDSLQSGLLAAIIVILLLLAANYQSFGVAIAVLSTVPAVLLGAMLMLLATGATLNLQSYMGIIMAVGVSVANAILIVTNAEALRLQYRDPFKAATVAASIRLRPILMTSLAMIAGMIPRQAGLVKQAINQRHWAAQLLVALLHLHWRHCLLFRWFMDGYDKKHPFNPFHYYLEIQTTKLLFMKYYTIFFLSVILFASCSENRSDNEKVGEDKVAVPQYQLATVEKSGVATIIKLPAKLAAYEEVSVFPKVNGYVKTVLVDIGSKVSQGSLLMTLEAPELEEASLQAREKYAKAIADFTIDKEHYQRFLEAAQTAGAVSPLDLSTLRAKMDADSSLSNAEKANWQMQETVLGYLKVTAPFAGVITERNVNPGALVSDADKDKPMLELKQVDHLRLQVDVPEDVAAAVKDKDTISFYTSAFPGKKMTGMISRSSMDVNAQYRSERMEIDVINKDGPLAPGMYADVIIYPKGNTNALSVPKSAVVISTERKYVLTMRNKKIVKVDVTTGSETGDSIEVYGALTAGEQVIINANDEIQESK